jgi:transcriptional regulator with XRE-family HTH domain
MEQLDPLVIGANVLRLRKAQGLKQRDIAGPLGVTLPAISRWENGTRIPNRWLLPRLARLLGVTVKELTSPLPPDLAQ